MKAKDDLCVYAGRQYAMTWEKMILTGLSICT